MNGYIFRCTDKTIEECFERRLFGDEEKYLSLVKKLKSGDTLFLYNCSTWQLSGIYEAVSDGGESMEPKAWGGKFPAQIKFKVKEKIDKTLTLDDLRGIVKIHGLYPYPELDEAQIGRIVSILKERG